MGAALKLEKDNREYPRDGFEAISKRKRNQGQTYPISRIIEEDSARIKEEKSGYIDANQTYDLISKHIQRSIENKFKEAVDRGINKRIQNLSLEEILKMKGVDAVMTSDDNKQVKAFQLFYSVSAAFITLFIVLILASEVPVFISIGGLLFSFMILHSVYLGEKYTKDRSDNGSNSDPRHS
jgi:hypothetical protein